MIACCVRPVRVSRPPITIGMSIRSPAMAFRRAFSSRRSGDPGRYARFGSLTGGGTRTAPAIPDDVVVRFWTRSTAMVEDGFVVELIEEAILQSYASRRG